MTDFDSDFIYAAKQEDELPQSDVECVYCGGPHDSKECNPMPQQEEYDRNEARESKAARAVADFAKWWDKEGRLYGQDRMSMRNAFIAGMVAQLYEERERLLRRMPL